MPRRVFVGRIKGRMTKKFIRHVCCRLPQFSLVESMRCSPSRGAALITIPWWHRAPVARSQVDTRSQRQFLMLQTWPVQPQRSSFVALPLGLEGNQRTPRKPCEIVKPATAEWNALSTGITAENSLRSTSSFGFDRFSAWPFDDRDRFADLLRMGKKQIRN